MKNSYTNDNRKNSQGYFCDWKQTGILTGIEKTENSGRGKQADGYMGVKKLFFVFIYFP